MKRVSVGWWIVGAGAVVVIALAVNGSLTTRFQDLWNWIKTAGTAATPAAATPAKTTGGTAPIWQTNGPFPIMNPVNLWRDIANDSTFWAWVTGHHKGGTAG